MSDARITPTERIIKHLRRTETDLANLLSIHKDEKVFEFHNYIHQKRIQMVKDLDYARHTA